MKFVHFFDDDRQNLTVSLELLVRNALQAEKVDYEILPYNYEKYGGTFSIPLKTNEGKRCKCKVIIAIEDEEENEE